MAKADKMDEISKLKEQLFFEPKNGYDLITAEEAAEADRYARAYIEFLNTSRTERESSGISSRKRTPLWARLISPG